MKPQLGDPWGQLTRQQVYDCLPPGMLPAKLLWSWAQLGPAVRHLSGELQEHLRM